jgi:hypothetical protein
MRYAMQHRLCRQPKSISHPGQTHVNGFIEIEIEIEIEIGIGIEISIGIEIPYLSDFG